MEYMASNLNEQKQLISSKNILFIQDIDGVCIPLVKDPMTRELESKYIYAVKEFAEEFFVLTCGEHEGPRGVNRIIERSLRSTTEPKNKELYLRGLAACGVEYQDSNGEISFEGVSEKELSFLSKVPSLIRPKFNYIVKNIFPELSQEDINFHAVKSICKTRFSPTINFNSLFDLVHKDSDKRKLIQISFEKMMNEIILKAESEGLKNSFFLHISPNLGNKNGREIIKLSCQDDIGSTDIQLLMTFAVTMLTKPHNLALGVIAGVALAAILFSRKVAKVITVSRVKENNLTTYKVKGQLFFVSKIYFSQGFDIHEHPENIVIDMSLAHIWDQSGVVALEQIIRKFQNGGSKVEIVGLNKESLNLFERLGGLESAH